MNKPLLKATALTALAETLLAAATLAAGLAGYRLLQATPYAGVALAVTLAIAADRILNPMLSDTFNPTIDRLRGQAAEQQETEAVR